MNLPFSLLFSAGLQKSVYNELFKATRQITESLSAAISVVTDPPASHMLHEIPEDAEQHLEDDKMLGDDDNIESLENREEKAGDMVGNNGVVTNTFYESIKALEDGIAKTAAKLESSVVRNSEKDEHTEDVTDNRFNLKINLKSERMRITDGDDSAECSPARTLAVPKPPPAPAITLKQILALDLNIESITRYQAKPKSMYTFLCAQQFRRDEYSWHFKNVHSDIHGGLSGWLEHRCPLAHYGCTYSARRLHPAPKGSKLVHNNIIEAFGVQPDVPSEHVRQSLTRKISSVKSSISRVNALPSDVLTSTPNNPGPLLNSLDAHNTKESTPEILTSMDYDSAVFINGDAALVSQEPITKNLLRSCDSSNTCNNSSREPDAMNSNVAADDDCDDVFAVMEETGNDIPRDNQENCDMLTSLPFEVLAHIAKFLDPFSLGNIALTNKVLREVACSLLETRGIVLLHWERQRVGQKLTWQTIYKVCENLFWFLFLRVACKNVIDVVSSESAL